MKLLARLLFCCALLLFASNLRAQEEEKPQDAEGCKDSPLITRFPGSIIHSCENKEYEQADFPLGTDKDGAALNKHVEGDFHSWDIGTRPGTSQIQVFRDFQTALKNAGFAIDYANSPGEIVAHKGNIWIYVDNKGEFYCSRKSPRTPHRSATKSIGPAMSRSTEFTSIRVKPRSNPIPKKSSVKSPSWCNRTPTSSCAWKVTPTIKATPRQIKHYRRSARRPWLPGSARITSLLHASPQKASARRNPWPTIPAKMAARKIAA